ncbi:MAG: DUF6273 domain-containing protein [Firmicutes bacterium]|nr:DUF6273 domain-containing protein [Bacillota bacterium]
MGKINEKLAEIGEIVEFGGYIWRVLDVQNGQALLLSEFVLESRAYHSENVAITWENCTLRHYLNGEFYEKFSVADRAKILQMELKNSGNPLFGTKGGNITTDNIFLLSLEEIVRYLGDSDKWANISNWVDEHLIDDKFNENRIAKYVDGTPEWWWLRSPGYGSYDAVGIDEFGRVNLGGGFVSEVDSGVRPALWIKLEF